jgi:hypothetical protein
MTTTASPFDTHVCLVSDQATPNLLPLIDEQWRPRHAVLATSPAMRARAEQLTALLRTRGMQVSRIELRDAYDYARLSEDFLCFLAEHEHESLALNVTGGTKLMAVAAQEVFRSAGKQAFYVSLESDEIVVIGEQGTSAPLRARLTIGEYLRVHGYEPMSAGRAAITAAQRDVAARLIDHAEAHGKWMGQINWLARQAKPSLVVELTEAQDDSRGLGQMLDLLIDAGLLRRAARRVSFPDEAARAFVNGGWLELHVLQVLRDLQGSGAIGDAAINLDVKHPDKVTRNEIDAAFMHRNTLHLIECKTANLAQPGVTDDDKATEAIYRMESLLKLGGLRTRGMIVDYRGALGTSQANRKRADASRIEIIGGRELRDLKRQISRRWLQRGA